MPATLLAMAIVMMVVSILGLVGSIMLNAFAFDKYDAYGEIGIPGSADLTLPAGEVTITFHTLAIGSSGGGGLPIPALGMNIEPPPGVPQPEVTENYGSTTSVNNDIRRRVWVAQIPVEGTYRITTDGKVSAFIDPRLAFGHPSRFGWLPWAFGAMLAVAVVDLVVSLVWLTRRRRGRLTLPVVADFAADPVNLADRPERSGQPAGAYSPTDEGVRIEQLKHLAALRDSGALTNKEFEQEKRRVLEG